MNMSRVCSQISVCVCEGIREGIREPSAYAFVQGIIENTVVESMVV